MGFKQAVAAAEGLEGAYRSGLGALRHADRNKVALPNARRLSGSVNLDEALAESRPNDPRWDYGIGVRQGRSPERVVWAEVHPAASSNVKEVLRKLAWLKRWLVESAPELQRMPADFVWIASGRVAIPRHAPQFRKLAMSAVRLVRQLRI
jgi:hypothetical protein